MISTQADVREAILGRAFPELLYGSDPDIERYFDLRAQGRSIEALGLYNARLKSKYPEENRRILLLSHYRTKDPRYRSLLRQSALDLAAVIIERIKRNIRYLTLPMEGVPSDDPYRLLKAIEQIVRFLPPGRFEAAASLDDYRRYARLIDFKRELMDSVSELVKEYLFESQAETEGANVDFMERSRQMERRKREPGTKRHFDLSKISFDDADLARIVLPPHIARKEDKVVGYCYRYWDLVSDPGFERVVLLYSRKNRTSHYEVYRAIKTGRERGFTDDEILNTVSTVLSSSYSYSVRGDIYMLSMWRRLKAGLSSDRSPFVPAARNEASAESKADRRDKPARPENGARSNASSGRLAEKTGLEKKPTAGGAGKKGRDAAGRQAKEADAARIPRSVTTGSVSDIIRKSSGHAYDVYHDIFLSSVRPSIRAALSNAATRDHGIFDASLNEAEEIVFGFLSAKYYDPYMDWAGSEERSRIEALGYALPSIQPLIMDRVGKL